MQPRNGDGAEAVEVLPVATAPDPAGPQATLHVARAQCAAIVDQVSGLATAGLADLRQALAAGDLADAEHLHRDLKPVLELQHAAVDLAATLAHTATRPLFLMSAALLYEAYHRLGAIQTEAILYGAGFRLGDLCVVEQVQSVDLAASERGYAAAEQHHTATLLRDLARRGSVVTAYFHMHPGRGPGANYPSSIDLANQERLERGGFVAVGGIFSRDGYLRSFSHRLQYTLHITGKGVRHVGTHQFHLTDP